MAGGLNNKFVAFLKLVRVENLVMVALTMFLIRHFIIAKILLSNGVSPVINDYLFSLLVISTVLIAAAGYIINDYFDVKTDLINHPDTVVVDRFIKRRVAIILHIAFTFIGVMLGVFCALKTGYLRLAIFHIVAATLLWFYSTHFKKRLLIGNIVVSLLTAAVAFMPFVYEMGLLQHIQHGFASTHQGVVLSCLKITGIFSLFAFVTSMAREIIKDMEDFEGDRQTGGDTMPIYWGMPASKLTAFFLLLITIILLLFVVYNTARFYHQVFTVEIVYILAGLIVPLTALCLMVIKASQPKDFKRASLLLKFIMLIGLGFSVIFYYN